jgi:hypothetical protein
VRGVEDWRGEGVLTNRPGARLDGMAGPARPARGCLGKSSPSPHWEHHTLMLPPASTHEAQAPEQAQQAPARRGTASRVLGDGRSRGERPPRSPRRGGGWRFHLVEMEEGAEESISPKVAMAEATGVGRRGQAVAAAIQCRQ